MARNSLAILDYPAVITEQGRARLQIRISTDAETSILEIVVRRGQRDGVAFSARTAVDVSVGMEQVVMDVSGD